MRRSPQDRKLSKRVKNTAESLKGTIGITAVGFAWQRVFTITGYLHDLPVTLDFRARSEGRCWKAVYISSPSGDKTVVHVLLVDQDQVYALKTNDSPNPYWVTPDPSVAAQLRRLHHR